MNYMKHYYDLCEGRLVLPRQKGEGEYFEAHHIFPKSVYGLDFEQTLVLLTAREHYIAHWLLWKGYQSLYGVDSWQCVKMARAFWRTCSGNPKVRARAMNSRAYEAAKEAYASTRRGKPGHMKGFKHSESTKNKMSEAKMGSPGPWLGKKRPSASEETKAKMRDSHSKSMNPTLKEEWLRTCNHCGVTMNKSHINQWHNDNCNHKGVSQ